MPETNIFIATISRAEFILPTLVRSLWGARHIDHSFAKQTSL